MRVLAVVVLLVELAAGAQPHAVEITAPRPDSSPYVLLVADEVDGVDFPQHFYSGYETLLDALAVEYNLWDHSVSGEPDLDDLAPYDVVIWVTGNSCGRPASDPVYGHSALSLAEEGTLRQWLETDGGRGLMLSGMWIGWNCVADADTEDQLPSTFFDWYVGLDYPEDNFTDWIEVDDDWTLEPTSSARFITESYDVNWLSDENYPDQVESAVGWTEAHWTDPDSLHHHKAVIANEGYDWRTVLFACPLEAVSGESNRRDILDRVLVWFMEGEANVVESSWGEIKAREW
jgi:hypothetical protein